MNTKYRCIFFLNGRYIGNDTINFSGSKSHLFFIFFYQVDHDVFTKLFKTLHVFKVGIENTSDI